MNQDKIYRRCLPAEKRIKEKYFWCPLLLTGTLVKGARQVGKTNLIKRVLKEEGCDVFEVNLIETPEAVSILQQAGTVDELMIGLSALGGQRLQKGKTVIFIDEIQKYKEMVTKIKFLVDDGSFRYVLSGSLQGVELTNIESAPIGYLSSIEMFPLDFEEFLQITDISDEVIDSLRRSFETRSAVLDAVNDKMLNLFRRYLVVGGMPEAVSVFADTKNVKDVITTHVLSKQQEKENEIKQIRIGMEKIEKKIGNLLDLRLSEDISRDEYVAKRAELEKLLAESNKKIDELENYQEIEDGIEERAKMIKENIEDKRKYDITHIPDEIVDAFVDKIVVHKDYFEWHLFFDDTTMMKVTIDGNKRNHDIFCETALDVNGSTGCNQA